VLEGWETKSKLGEGKREGMGKRRESERSRPKRSKVTTLRLGLDCDWPGVVAVVGTRVWPQESGWV
jgi:hypothetical protein